MTKSIFSSIRMKFILVFSLVALLIGIIGSLVFIMHEDFQENNADILINDENQRMQKLFENLIGSDSQMMAATLEVLKEDSNLKDLIMKKDRDSLYNNSYPIFNELRSKYGITNLNFISADGEIILRMQNPQLHGDIIQRNIFIQAKSTGNTASGIDLGKTAFALRVITPVYIDGNDEPIGYIEIGENIDHILEILKESTDDEFAIVVHKDSFLKEEINSMIQKGEGFEIGEYYAVSSTMDHMVKCLGEINTEVSGCKNTYKDKLYGTGRFPLLNRTDASVFMMVDMTNNASAVRIIEYAIGVFIILIILIIIIGGLLISNLISKPINELYNATIRLKEGNYDVRTDIKQKDEIGELADAFNKTAKILGEIDAERKRIDSAKTQFLSITSHELRSPMTPMIAQLEMLIAGYHGKISPAQKKSIQMILRNSKRLDNLIQDILEISRIEAARLKFDIVKTDLKKEAASLIRSYGIQRIKDKVPKLPIIEADPSRVMQVLRNLIDNALKFSKSDILVGAEVKEKEIEFWVKDHGIGISAENQKKIFDAFFQAEETMYRKYGGVGLGLTICKGILSAQSGKIWVESKLGEGCTFHFTVQKKPKKVEMHLKDIF